MMILNEIADTQAQIDTLRAYFPITITIGIVLLAIALILIWKRKRISNDADLNVILSLGAFLAICIGVLFIILSIKSQCIDIPILEAKLANLKAINVWYG